MTYQKIKVISTTHAPDPIGPYSQAIAIGNIIFISGQIPILPDTQSIPIDIYTQTYQALQNIKNIIKTNNLTVYNIVKTTLFITNLLDLPEINTSYKNFFKKNSAFPNRPNYHYPARSCIEINKLPKNAKIMIEAIAMHTNN